MCGSSHASEKKGEEENAKTEVPAGEGEQEGEKAQAAPPNERECEKKSVKKIPSMIEYK